MTDTEFAKAIIESVKRTEDMCSFESPTEYSLLDVRYRPINFPHRAKHPVYDVIIVHNPLKAGYNLSVYEIHLNEVGDMLAMFNGHGFFDRIDGKVKLSNSSVEWAWFTREIVDKWFADVENRLNGVVA